MRLCRLGSDQNHLFTHNQPVSLSFLQFSIENGIANGGGSEQKQVEAKGQSRGKRKRKN